MKKQERKKVAQPRRCAEKVTRASQRGGVRATGARAEVLTNRSAASAQAVAQAVLAPTHPISLTTDENIRALVRATLAYYGDWFKKVESRPDSPFHGVYARFRRFAKEAVGDLEILARQGVGPPVVVCLMFERILMRVDEEWERKSRSDWRKLSSYNYWRRGWNAMRKADEFLSELGGFSVTRLIADYYGSPEFDPFVKVCRKGINAAAGLHELMLMIEKLKLHEPGWTLKYEPGGKPLYRRTNVTGRRKSGRAREGDWGLIALGLHEYIRRRTGRPQWSTIARLLHFAGFRDFAELCPPDGFTTERGGSSRADPFDYKGRIRARVGDLSKDPGSVRAAQAAVNDFQSMYERVENKIQESPRD